MSYYELTPNQTYSRLKIALAANIPCMVTGQPACGKSSIVRQLAEDENLYFIDFRISQVQQFDLLGYPTIEEVVLPDGTITKVSRYVPMDVFPLENYTLPFNEKLGKPYAGYLIFLDEFNSGDKYVQAAAYKLLLDRMVGQQKLHHTTRIIAAGNRLSDNAIVHKVSTAIQSRLTHISMIPDYNEFMDYVDKQVAKGEWHPAVFGFLHYRKDLMCNFDPKKDVETYASPRTYEFLAKELNAGLLDLGKEIYRPAIIGTIGEQAGIEFCAFIEIMNSLPSLNQINTNPLTAPLPQENGGGGR